MKGLTNEEVLKSRELYGSNKLPEPKMKKWYEFAKEALTEKITMILIAIAELHMILAHKLMREDLLILKESAMLVRSLMI